MPSPKHAANVERVLTRAARECEGEPAWFGEGLPQGLRSALEAAGREIGGAAPALAFVDASQCGSMTDVDLRARRVVAMSADDLDQLERTVHATESCPVPVARLICPFAVFDFTREGLRVREILHGLTAADLQAQLAAPLWAGPDLTQL